MMWFIFRYSRKWVGNPSIQKLRSVHKDTPDNCVLTIVFFVCFFLIEPFIFLISEPKPVKRTGWIISCRAFLLCGSFNENKLRKFCHMWACMMANFLIFFSFEGPHRRKAVLVKHWRAHTEDKPYHCEHCKNEFSDLEALKSTYRRETISLWTMQKGF